MGNGECVSLETLHRPGLFKELFKAAVLNYICITQNYTYLKGTIS